MLLISLRDRNCHPGDGERTFFRSLGFNCSPRSLRTSPCEIWSRIYCLMACQRALERKDLTTPSLPVARLRFHLFPFRLAQIPSTSPRERIAAPAEGSQDLPRLPIPTSVRGYRLFRVSGAGRWAKPALRKRPLERNGAEYRSGSGGGPICFCVY